MNVCQRILAIMVLAVVMGMFSLLSEAALKMPTVEENFPGLATGILKTAELMPMKGGVLLTADGLEIQESHLKKVVEGADPNDRQQLEKNLFFVLEQQTTIKLLLKEAESAGISSDGKDDNQIIEAYFNRMVEGATASDAEVRMFYDQHKDMVGNMPFEQIKDQIRSVVIQKKQQEFVDSHIANLGRNKNLRVNREWAKTQNALAKDNPVDNARRSGKPTMVEFGATGCIPCDMMQPVLASLRKKYPEKLNVIFVNVREDQILGSRFGIRSIPVQVFYDKDGKEVFRHEGFYPEAEIAKHLKTMGIN